MISEYEVVLSPGRDLVMQGFRLLFASQLSQVNIKPLPWPEDHLASVATLQQADDSSMVVALASTLHSWIELMTKGEIRDLQDYCVRYGIWNTDERVAYDEKEFLEEAMESLTECGEDYMNALIESEDDYDEAAAQVLEDLDGIIQRLEAMVR